MMSDGELDNIVSEYMNQRSKTTGHSYITGLRVARRDPVVTRRTYLMPWPKFLWHSLGARCVWLHRWLF